MQPRDMKRALRRYDIFHDLDPRKTGAFSAKFDIPSRITRVGTAAWVAYRSDKWGEGWHNYIHDHDAGVKMYLTQPDDWFEGVEANVPQFIIAPDTLVLIGECLGYGFELPDGTAVETEIPRPRPELYCIPSGRALLIIDGKRRVEAIMHGGKLAVEDRGIVG